MAMDPWSLLRGRRKKVIFWVLTVLMSLGLVGSSLAWSLSGGGARNTSTTNQQRQEVDINQIIKELEAKAEADPKDTENLERLAAAYLNNNEKEKATQTYQKIVDIDPKNTEVALSLAMTYFLTSKYDDAEKQVKNVLEVEPNNQDAHYYYGLILGYGKQDYQGGIIELEKYIEMAKTGKDVQVAKDLVEEWKSKVE